ncbi:MAG: FixH family protein [Gammaproteobacteria bacterium]
MTNTPRTVQQPWYRHYWVWLLMIPPAAAVVGGFTTAWLAGGPPALVVDDYGEIGKATEQRRTRDWRAAELGLSAELQLSASQAGEPQALRLQLTSAAEWPVPDQLQLELIHPTMENLDQSLSLSFNGKVYVAQVTPIVGRRYVQVGDMGHEWRLVGELSARSENVSLQPGSGVRVGP